MTIPRSDTLTELIDTIQEYDEARPEHHAEIVAHLNDLLLNLSPFERSQWISKIAQAQAELGRLHFERDHDENPFARRAAANEIPVVEEKVQRLAYFALIEDVKQQKAAS